MRTRSSNRSARRLGACVVVGLALRWAAPACAEPPAAESADAKQELSATENQQLFQQALTHYDTGEYDEAIGLFRELYRRTRSPTLLFNMAQSYRLKGDCKKALELYGQFVRFDPDSPDRGRAMSRIAALGTCEAPAAPPVTAPANPAPRVDSPAPPAQVVLAPTVARSSRWPSSRTAAVFLGGAALALAVTGGYYAWRAHDDADQISDLYMRGGPWDARAMSLDADGRFSRDSARALLAVAGISGVAGLLAYLYHRKVDGSP